MSLSPFAIQPIQELGTLSASDDGQLEHALGDEARGGGYAAYLGASITLKRLYVAAGIVVLIFVCLMVRAAQLQLLQGEENYALAEGNRVRHERLPSSRGELLDATGAILAYNEPAFTLLVEEEAWQSPETAAQLAMQLVLLLEQPLEQVQAQLMSGRVSGEERLVTRTLDQDAAMRILASPEAYPKLHVEAGVRRVYATGGAETLSSLLGYTGLMNEQEYARRQEQGYRPTDVVGKVGLEASYEEILRGFPGERAVEVDARGRAQSVLSERAAVDGSDLRLNIRKEFQSYIEERLDTLMQQGGFQNASVVVMDPRNGAIEALVSYPGYDANLFTGSISQEVYQQLLQNPARPLFTRAYSGQYPSGSTIKPIVTALALNDGVISSATTILSTGGLRIGQFFFPDWKGGGHGYVDVRQAIAQSVNTFFYMIGGGWQDMEGLGLERMMQGAARFGLGSPLGLDVPGEASGFLPSAAWKEETKGEPWYIGDTYHVSIGQGDLLVTPLQVAAFTAVFANRGTLWQPQLVDGWEAQGRWHDLAPAVLDKDMVSANAIQVVREGLRETIVTGSGRRLSTLPVTSAGKTGTAEWSETGLPHAWFTGFAPYEDPQVVVTVLVERAGEGSSVAVPVAYDILQWWYNHVYER